MGERSTGFALHLGSRTGFAFHNDTVAQGARSRKVDNSAAIARSGRGGDGVCGQKESSPFYAEGELTAREKKCPDGLGFRMAILEPTLVLLVSFAAIAHGQSFDLTCSSVTASSNVQQGGTITVTCTVHKTGANLSPSTGYVQVHLYLSQDRNAASGPCICCGDPCAFNFINSTLNDGNETQSKEVTVPSNLEGPYYVVAKVDGPNFWNNETNENNNLCATLPGADGQPPLKIWRPGSPGGSSRAVAREWQNAAVYWINYSQRWWIFDQSTFFSLGYTDNEVAWYATGALSAFSPGPDIVRDNAEFLYKNSAGPQIYRIEGGRSRPFIDEDALMAEYGASPRFFEPKPGNSWLQSVYPVGNLLGPDLRPSEVSAVRPTSGTLQVNVTVARTGTKLMDDASHSYVRVDLFLSRSSSEVTAEYLPLSDASSFLRTDNTDLNSTGSGSATGSYGLPTGLTGIWYVVAWADFGVDLYRETAEGNNVAGTPLPPSGLPTRTLSVQSSPINAVGVTVSPPDRDGTSNCSTPCQLTYEGGPSVQVTAPATIAPYAFSEWQRGGQTYSTQNSTSITVNQDLTLVAMYTAPGVPTLTLTSPAAEAVLRKGVAYTICWRAENYVGEILLELYRGGVDVVNRIETIVTGIPASRGCYSPFVPEETLADGNDYYIRISSPDYQVVGFSAAFSIQPPGDGFSDDFNRPDAGIVGNGWHDIEIPGHTGDAQIASGRLTFPTADAGVVFRPYEGGAGASDITVLWRYSTTTAGGADGVSVMHPGGEGDRNRNVQYGLTLIITANAVTVYEGSAPLGAVSFNFAVRTEYSFRWDIYQDFSMKVWVWASTGQQSPEPQILIPDFTPTTPLDFANWAIGNRGGASFDDFSVRTPAIGPPPSKVVFVPGIQGTELIDDSTGELIWLDAIRVGQDVNDQFLFRLLLQTNGEGSDTRNRCEASPAFTCNSRLNCPFLNQCVTGGRAMRLGNLLNLAPYFTSYTDLGRFLHERGYPLDKRLFLFGYDWRLDLSTIVQSFRGVVTKLTEEGSARRVDVVVHSMGGLVVRAYLQHYKSDHRIGKIVFCGTPHLGSPTAFAILRGYRTLIKWLGADLPALEPDTQSFISQNFPAVYQLLPRFDFITRDSQREAFSASFAKLSNPTLVERADTFHAMLAGEYPSDIQYFAINGSGRVTLLGLEIVDDKCTKLAIDLSGDGTVTTASAQAFAMAENFFINEEHKSIPGNAAAQRLILSILDTGVPDRSIPGISTTPVRAQGVKRFAGCSPITLQAVDTAGQIVGRDEDGVIREEIAGSAYFSFEHNEAGVVPASGEYTLKLKASESGLFTLSVETVDADGAMSGALEYASVPVRRGGEGRVVLSPSVESPELVLDVDGDGADDFILMPGEDVPDEIKRRFTMRGDANLDAAIDISDGVFILNFLFLGGDGPACADIANANSDGQVDMSDAVFLFSYLFLGGPAPEELAYCPGG